MSFQTDKFGPISTSTSGGGGFDGVLPPNTYNWAQPSFNLIDSTGKVVNSIKTNENNQAIYTKTYTGADVGQKTITSRFTGDSNYAPGSADSFTMHVGDSVDATLKTVNQIVAGDGIYISAPNGQGVVTVSTQPLQFESITEDLLDIAWSVRVPGAPTRFPGQFTAVGSDGIVLRSRDGHNWTRLESLSFLASGITGGYYGVASQISTQINSATGYFEVLDLHLEYTTVGSIGLAAYGRNGKLSTRKHEVTPVYSDGITRASQLIQQRTIDTPEGVVTEDLNATSIFINGNPNTFQPQQFYGGLTDFSRTTLNASDLFGAPLYTSSYALSTYYSIDNVWLEKQYQNERAVIYSIMGAESIWLEIEMSTSDIRALPPNGYYGYTSPNTFAPNNQHTFWPYLMVYIDGITFAGFAFAGTPWVRVDANTARLRINLGTAGGDPQLAQGQHEIDVYLSSGDIGTDFSLADYHFTSFFTVAP